LLTRLFISNYALIDRLEIDFQSGLTIVTGETGAGKSILLGALSLIMGERADTKAVRDTTQKTIVEATLSITDYGLQTLFEQADVDYDEDCILRREVSPNGRSRAFVNDTPVSLTFMREVATRLVDIHSQHSNMLLADPQFQLSIIDSLADNVKLREQYADIYGKYVDAQQKLKRFIEQHEKDKAEEDYMRFQLDQLQAMHLQPGEDTQLEQEQARLSNITEIKQSLWQIDHLFNDDQLSVIQHLKEIVNHLHGIEYLMPELEGMTDRAESALIDIKDMSATIAGALENLQLDPAQLERIENRLNDIFTLERKHQVDSVDKLIDIQKDYENRLMSLEKDDGFITTCQGLMDGYKRDAIILAEKLTDSRKQAARSFSKQLVDRASALALTNLRFDVNFSETDLIATGHDRVEFNMAFNKSQPLMPVKDTASGGEISRVMLCIKAIIAQQVNLPTLIFDEVDTGVSGDTASRMGEMMGDIARNIQVIAITHLPQVASHGNQHLKVYKSDDDQRTNTHVVSLEAEQHVMEIARMLSGRDLNQAAIDNARALINQNQAND
jgi:DNA repair protein RecN (Recombination protein N)